MRFDVIRVVAMLAIGLSGTPVTGQEPVEREPDGPGTVEEMQFESGDVRLTGRLWLPDGPGPHPAAVFLPGSGRSIRNLDLDPDPVPFRFVEMGIAYFAWDKRGVRDSEGVFEPISDTDPEAQLARLRLLASDAAAAMRYLAGRDDIDASQIGAWAFSQGGWVAPLLESVGASPAFIIIAGGPAVTIGEELAYSAIADEAREATRAGQRPLVMDDLYRRLEAVTDTIPESYDPLQWLETVTTPTLYLLGEYDLSVPTRRSVERLESIGRRFEWIDYRVFPRANHGVATRDPDGQWYPAHEFYATQWHFLINLGILEPVMEYRVRVVRETR